MPASLRRSLALALSLVLGVAMSLGAVSAAQAVPGPALSGLTISTGSLNPGFSSGVTNYDVTVPFEVTSFSFTPTAADASLTLSVWDGNGNVAPASGTAVNAILRLGANSFFITVTDASTASTQYSITVTRSAPPAPAYDPRLSSLTVSAGILSPVFDPAVTSYSVAVPYATSSITLSATSSDTVTIVNPSRPMTGGTSFLQVGGNLLQVTVTAVDGTTTRSYDVFVTRDSAPTANVDLDVLALSAGTLTPAFDPAVTTYTATVPYAVRSLQITASPADVANDMTINNLPMADGVAATVTVNYNGGSGYAIRVVAANGAEKSYSVQITRDPPSTDADLTGLSLSEGTLSPVFANAETAYTATVPYLTTALTVTPTLADITAIARVNGHDIVSGTPSQAVALSVGANAIVVEVTAEDGVTTTSRTVTVTREAPELRLSDLTVSDGALSPAFDADTAAYTLTVPYLVTSLDVTATALESAWGLTIDGDAGGSASIPLAVGTHTVTVTVTALYGESLDYTIEVTREVAPTPQLTFTTGLTAGQSAGNAPIVVAGADLLPGGAATLTMHSTPVVLTTALVPGSAAVTLSAHLPASVPAGAHRVVFDSFAQDGTPVSATIWFTVLRDGTIGAVSLAGPVAYTEAALAATGVDVASDAASALLLVLLGGGLLALGRTARRRARRA
jgi:hypothetical protein